MAVHQHDFIVFQANVTMVQYPRHAVVEFDPDGGFKSWNCAMCDYEAEDNEQLFNHLATHNVKHCKTTVITKGDLFDGESISHTTSYVLEEEDDGRERRVVISLHIFSYFILNREHGSFIFL